ncbi:MAG: radical SAM protein [Candidatus Wallbacteria bacterium]|nr:radical SAM protein [Candidatus Wallbacteria bacterium]
MLMQVDFPLYHQPVFRPPAEADSLIVQVTHGCSRNTCRFCGMYKGVKYETLDREYIEYWLDRLPRVIFGGARRVFLADGNAMCVGFPWLREILTLLNKKFRGLRRVTIYATPADILNYQAEELAELKSLKLWMAYIGLETGCNELLKKTGKQGSAEDFGQALAMLRQAGIRSSVTAILGLGGKEFTNRHSEDTADAVNKGRPDYFSLLTLIRGGNEEFIASIKQLTVREVFLELRRIVERIETRTIFRTNHASNILQLEGTLPDDRLRILFEIDTILRSSEEFLDREPGFFGESGY